MVFIGRRGADVCTGPHPLPPQTTATGVTADVSLAAAPRTAGADNVIALVRSASIVADRSAMAAITAWRMDAPLEWLVNAS
jgi:hypothetical protein